jgi:hypothetical protein
MQAWQQVDKPLVWLDPSFDGQFSNLCADLVYADFAAIPVTTTNLSTSFVYFGRSATAFSLLRFWNGLCLEFGQLPSTYLLDAAWATVVAQCALTTVWIPPAKSGALTSNHDFSNASFNTPGQREARRASRTSAPEPQCTITSSNPSASRGPVTLIIAAAEATACQTAATQQAAIRAFARDSGAFSTLGVFIVKDMSEAARAAMTIPTGWSMFVSPGVEFPDDIFSTLSTQADADYPIFIGPKCLDRRANTKEINFQVTTSQAVFCKAELVEKGAWKSRPQPFLRVV